MIEFGSGNLLRWEAEALVNTVNTVGVMGKGVALQFKQAFPENYRFYRRACDQGVVELGRMLVWDSGQLGPRRYIINFPTKGHWRANSRIGDVREGLKDLVRVVSEYEIESVAIPALGCGNGGLEWSDVLPLMQEELHEIPARVVIFPPAGAPAAREMVIATTKPAMTYGRAALLALVGRYANAALHERFELARPGASLLEIQKVMYLLQSAGQPLRLKYAKGLYGPYAENLNKVLESMEGHYIRGYGDRTRTVLALDPIELAPGAEDEAREWLKASRPDVETDVDRVLDLVQGWENAYGMELLATVLYASEQDEQVVKNPDKAVEYVHSWNRRKAATFPQQHVKRAWERLTQFDWLRLN
ncbi:macro domain-containing protein [Pseudonocardia sp. KRD291]|uniref:type II toxin-antitoxin system antitoxin DNA ADP-ribosyl glycohydrolase DarG n=1 Tax=Pseudonocardia sp. KRD291 TaxID=2792007 RepID=UPI001C49EFD3|nr:macro domain-containing protein [Pseudonocardia sp. KRD291]MBW0103662.1 macro domain-containing protein [Pseudonocardia sp. KRD291]